MAHRSPIFALAVVAGALGLGCGQHPQLTAAAARASRLPPECMGLAARCVVLTTIHGVNVYRNHGDGGFCTAAGDCAVPPGRYGPRWQCTELFNRYFALHFGTSPLPGDAGELLTNARGVPGLEVHPNGGPVPPRVGDALVFTGAGTGHVAIVAKVEPGWIHVAEQNVRGNGRGRYRYHLAANRVEPPRQGATMMAAGWIHATSNRHAPDAVTVAR